jgi:glycosyltransferase involved in cell wall biosynthesis
MDFTLVIPAYNEEEAIGPTLRRALAARKTVLAKTPVKRMNVVVVNDGSRDCTQEIINQPEFDEVIRVRFPENRCYGAAIKAGFRACPATLVGFMDADGTCDPEFCVELINRLNDSQADVVLASRLGTDSKMPKIRRVGNRIFAALLTTLAGKSVVDTASGFRVIRHRSLKLMSPLPNGLHFTPAMSCICVLDPRLKIEEVAMPYEERTGRSKLSVIKDGFRFLYTILFNFCCYSPVKFALFASLALLLVTALGMGGLWLLGAPGIVQGSIGLAAGLMSLLLVLTGLIVHQVNYLVIGPRQHVHRAEQLLQKLLGYKPLIGGGLVTTVAGGAGLGVLGLVAGLLSEFEVAVAAGVLAGVAIAGMVALTFGLVTHVIWAVSEKQRALDLEDYELLGVMEIRRPGERAASRLEQPAASLTSAH